MLSFCQDLNLCCTAVDDSENRDCCSNGKLGDNKFNWNDPTLTGHVNASMLYDVYDSRQAIAGAVTNSTSNNIVQADSEDGNTVSEGAIIGVGVGLGVPLLIALATCIWLFLSLRKEQAKSHESQETHSYIEPKQGQGGNNTSPGPSQNESASRVASHDPTIATQVAPGNFHPSMNGYAPETKNSNYMWPPPPPPAMQQAPVAELSDERTPVEVQSMVAKLRYAVPCRYIWEERWTSAVVRPG